MRLLNTGTFSKRKQQQISATTSSVSTAVHSKSTSTEAIRINSSRSPLKTVLEHNTIFLLHPPALLVLLRVLNCVFKIVFIQIILTLGNYPQTLSRYKIPVLTCYLLPLSFGYALSKFYLIFNYFFCVFLDFQ